jgi:hypothetical protein
MLVYGEAFAEDPEYQAGSIDFWCVQTGRPLGPDGGGVDLDACSEPERPCYQEF